MEKLVSLSDDANKEMPNQCANLLPAMEKNMSNKTQLQGKETMGFLALQSQWFCQAEHVAIVLQVVALQLQWESSR